MINFAPFFDDLDNDIESIEMILEAYIEEYADCHIRLKSLFDQKNWAELYLLSHSLKGILTGFGELEVTVLLEEIESETHGGGPTSEDTLMLAYSLLPAIQTQIENELLALS